MARYLFVNELYIKQFTPIGDLVQYTEIEPKLHLAQDTYIQDFLGSNFYNYLQESAINNTLNPDELELVSLIRPALAWRVASKTLPYLHYQIKNKGVQQQRGEYTDPADLSVIRFLKGDLDTDADFYSQRLVNWLCKNRNLFPEFKFDNSDDISPKNNDYDCGLQFY